MQDNSRAELQRFGIRLLDSFVTAVVERHPGKAVTSPELQAAAKTVEGSPAFSELLDHFHRRITEEATKHLSRQQRRNPFRRLITHPIGAAFLEEYLSRDILPSYFNFMHLVVGDEEMRAYDEQCQVILDEHEPGEDFDWDRFYQDPRAKLILWTVLKRIAESFKRFELRRDWLIGLMQTKHQAVSLASNAFLPLRHEDSAEQAQSRFGQREFLIMFECLFASVHSLSTTDAQHFEAHFAATPDTVFGDLLKHLDQAKA